MVYNYCMSLNLKRIRALCFDVDGTLSDTDDLYTQKIANFLPRFLFRDPQHIARRFVMWVESPGNALIGLSTDNLGGGVRTPHCCLESFLLLLFFFFGGIHGQAHCGVRARCHLSSRAEG